MKSKKHKKITDDMIGGSDKICACAAAVGDIIAAQNEGKPENASLKKIMDGLKQKGRGTAASE